MRLKNTANGLIAAGMAILCLISNLTPAFAIGEDDPLWTRNTYEKKVFTIGNKLLNDNNISEAIAFRVNYTTNGSNVNAFSTDVSNTVTVEMDLLRFLESDDELAFVLGHELGHIMLRHVTKSVQRAEAKQKRLNTLGMFAFLPVVAQVYYPMAYMSKQAQATPTENINSQKDELDADRLGYQFMVKAGYDPEKGMIAARKIFHDGTENIYNRSHPPGSTRIAHWQQLIYADKLKKEQQQQQQTVIENKPQDLQVQKEVQAKKVETSVNTSSLSENKIAAPKPLIQTSESNRKE